MQSYIHLLYCAVTSFRLLEIEIRELEVIEAYNIEILEAYDIRQKKFLKGIFVKKIFWKNAAGEHPCGSVISIKLRSKSHFRIGFLL